MAAQLETAEFMEARILLPVGVRCNTCCHEMQKGAKFISLKQAVDGETYLGRPIYRYLFKCSSCSSMIKIMQDLRNAGYVAEAGATWLNVGDEVAAEEKEFSEYISSVHRVTFDELMADLDEMKSRRKKAENQSQDSKSEEVGHVTKSLMYITFGSRSETDIRAALDDAKSMEIRGSLKKLDMP